MTQNSQVQGEVLQTIAASTDQQHQLPSSDAELKEPFAQRGHEILSGSFTEEPASQISVGFFPPGI